MTYRDHLSPSLEWKWHVQDFRIQKVDELTESSVAVTFIPKYRLWFPLARFYYGGDLPLTTLSSVRLGSIASIICAGLALKKPRKDGEVIARDFHVDCRRPVKYDEHSSLRVVAQVRVLRETKQFHLLKSEFIVGADGDHAGKAKLLYAKPNVKGLSYL